MLNCRVFQIHLKTVTIMATLIIVDNVLSEFFVQEDSHRIWQNKASFLTTESSEIWLSIVSWILECSLKTNLIDVIHLKRDKSSLPTNGFHDINGITRPNARGIFRRN